MFRLNNFFQWVVFIIILNPFSTLLLANHFMSKTNKKISELLGRNDYLFGRKVDAPILSEKGSNDEIYRKIMARSRYDQGVNIADDVGLVKKSRAIRRVGKRLTPEIEQKILEYSLMFPTQGQGRVANELKKQGIQVSGGGVRKVWLRHNMQLASLRVKRMEQQVTGSASLIGTNIRIKRIDKNVIKVTPMTLSLFKDDME